MTPVQVLCKCLSRRAVKDKHKLGNRKILCNRSEQHVHIHSLSRFILELPGNYMGYLGAWLRAGVEVHLLW